MASARSVWRSALAALTLLVLMSRWTGGAICEPIRIPMCHWLPYNLTRMPNLLFHSAQRNAQLVIEQYQPLVETNCSRHLLFFLCAMFAPMCPLSFRQEVIPPCRGVCEEARRGCEPVLRQYNLSWPKALDCDQLPMYDRGVCISPESIVTTPPSGKMPGDENRQPDSDTTAVVRIPRCEQKPATKLKLKKIFTGGRYSFAMTAVYNRPGLLSDGTITLRVSPRLVFYHKRVKVGRDAVDIHLPGGCLPLRLRPGKSYLLLGHEDRHTNRLLLTADGFIDVWRPKTLKRLKKWKHKLAKSRYKKRRATKQRPPRGNTRRGQYRTETRSTKENQAPTTK